MPEEKISKDFSECLVNIVPEFRPFYAEALNAAEAFYDAPGDESKFVRDARRGALVAAFSKIADAAVVAVWERNREKSEQEASERYFGIVASCILENHRDEYLADPKRLADDAWLLADALKARWLNRSKGE